MTTGDMLLGRLATAYWPGGPPDALMEVLTDPARTLPPPIPSPVTVGGSNPLYAAVADTSRPADDAFASLIAEADQMVADLEQSGVDPYGPWARSAIPGWRHLTAAIQQRLKAQPYLGVGVMAEPGLLYDCHRNGWPRSTMTMDQHDSVRWMLQLWPTGIDSIHADVAEGRRALRDVKRFNYRRAADLAAAGFVADLTTLSRKHRHRAHMAVVDAYAAPGPPPPTVFRPHGEPTPATIQADRWVLPTLPVDAVRQMPMWVLTHPDQTGQPPPAVLELLAETLRRPASWNLAGRVAGSSGTVGDLLDAVEALGG